MKALAIFTLTAITGILQASASETLLHLDFDNDTHSVRSGDDLMPYVYDGHYNPVRDNAGFLRLPSGTPIWKELDATSAAAIKTAGEELTIEFFIKGNPNSLAAWQYLLTIGGPWDWSVRIDADGSRNMRVSTSPGGEHVSSTSLVDGKWHHVAITVKPTAGGSHIEAFVDYKSLYATDTTSAFKYSRGGVLSLNQNTAGGCGGCDVDEVRYSRGVLSVPEFLRHGTTKPVAVGEPIAYVKFDNGTMGSSCHPEYDGTHAATTAAYSNHQSMRVVDGNDDIVSAENKKYVTLKDGHYINSSPELKNGNAATIEFFIKGDPNSMSEWQTVFSYGYSNTGTYGLLIQVNAGKKTLWAKPGCGSSTGGVAVNIDLTDGKWHHFAAAFSPSETTVGKTHVEFYADHVRQGSGYEFTGEWNALKDRTVYFAPSCTYDFDEFRISKGTLASERLMRLQRTVGFFTVVR